MTTNTDNEQTELEPCWCRNGTAALSIKAHIDHGTFGCRERGKYIYCSNCWACGPASSTEAQAREFWNRMRSRVSASPAAPLRNEERVYKAALETISESECKGECSRIAILALSYPPDIVTAPAAPVADRALYSELIHIAAELARGDGFLSTCAEDISPRLNRADILKTAEGQEYRLKDWANRVRQVADKLAAAASTASTQEDAEHVSEL